MLNGQPVDGAKLHLARLNLILEEVLEHPGGFIGDDRADPVPAAHADYQLVKVLKIGELLVRLHPFDPFELGAHDLFKFC